MFYLVDNIIFCILWAYSADEKLMTVLLFWSHFILFLHLFTLLCFNISKISIEIH